MNKRNNDIESSASFSSIFKNNWFIFKLALKEAPFYTIHTITSGMIHEIVVFIEHIYLIGFVIDCIQYQRPFWNAALFILSVFVGVRLIQIIGNIFVATIKPKGEEKIYKRIRLQLYDKAEKIDLECYDNPQFYTDFVWAMSDVTERFQKVMKSISDFLGAVVGAMVIAVYMLTTDRVGVLLAVISFAISAFALSKFNKLRFQLDLKLKPLFRKRDYINRVFYLADFAKEIRVGDIKEKLYEDFTNTNLKIEEETDKGTKWFTVLNFTAGPFAKGIMFDGIYVVYLLYMTIVKEAFGFGTMVTLFGSSGNLSNCIENFSRVIPEFQQHSLYIDKILKFLDYDIKITNNEKALDTPNKAVDIKLENVSFSYNEASGNILKNINMTIKAGEKIALVGYNGAGKTTLVKLLMRLYDVSSGEIWCNNHSIKDYDVNKYRKIFGTVFQDYQLFAASLRENVIMEKAEKSEQTDKKVTEALGLSGFTEKLKSLSGGLDTQLTREFDNEGTNLSGGESQKVSIGRVLYKDCPFIILDEPSSALDPISEYNLNNTILNLSHDKTIIFISHRLSTTKMADRIYMLENGEIVEQGNHEELMNYNGKYAEMFNLQAEKYR